MPAQVRCVSEVQRLIKSVFVFLHTAFLFYIRFPFFVYDVQKKPDKKDYARDILAIDLQQI